MSVEALEAQQEQLTQQIQALTREIVAAISEDITTFTEREVRKRFLENVEFSESITDEKLTEIKAAIRQQSTQQGSELREALVEPALWLTAVPDEAPGKQLEPNTQVWEALQRIPRATAELLEAFGFPPDDDAGGYNIEYRTPAYFVAGKYLPGLIEKYWGLLSRRQALREELATIDLEVRRKTLRDRWDQSS